MASRSNSEGRDVIARRFGTPSSFKLPDWCADIAAGGNRLYNECVERERHVDLLCDEWETENPAASKADRKLVRATAVECGWGTDTPDSLRKEHLSDPCGLHGAWGTATRMVDMFTAAKQRVVSRRVAGLPAEMHFRSLRHDPWVIYHQVQESPTVLQVSKGPVRGFYIEQTGKHAVFHISLAPRAGLPVLSIPITNYGRSSNKLPDDWIVKAVTVTAKPEVSKTGQRVTVAVSLWKPIATSVSGTGDVFVAVQWTARGGGATQVATILGAPGVRLDLSGIGQPFLDFDDAGYISLVLPAGGRGFHGPGRQDYDRLFASKEDTNCLRGYRDLALNKLRRKYPMDSVVQGAKSANHLARLMREMADPPRYLQRWYSDPRRRTGDAHLASWQSHGPEQFRMQRDTLYQEVAKTICVVASRVILQSHPMAGQTKKDDDPINSAYVRRNKAFVAPGRFAQILRSTARRMGVTVIDEDWYK